MFGPNTSTSTESVVLHSHRDREFIHTYEDLKSLFSEVFDLEKYDIIFMGGSGTTAISAKKLGRRYLGFELSKEYFKTSQKRIKKLETLEKIEQTSKKFFNYNLDNSK